MDHDFGQEIAQAMTAFGIALERLTSPPIDLAEMVEDHNPPELANKLNALLAAQEGMIPTPVRLALENWVDAWFTAHVMSQNAEHNPDTAVREAALNSYVYAMGQMLAIQQLLDSWGEDGPPSVFVLK